MSYLVSTYVDPTPTIAYGNIYAYDNWLPIDYINSAGDMNYPSLGSIVLPLYPSTSTGVIPRVPVYSGAFSGTTNQTTNWSDSAPILLTPAHGTHNQWLGFGVQPT